VLALLAVVALPAAVAYGVLVLAAVARARRRTAEVPREPAAAAR
jgi:hypothetical protein